MRNDDLLNDVLARKLAPFDDRFHDTTERDRDLDHPTELGDCEMGGGCNRFGNNDAVKVCTLEDGYKLATRKSCDVTLDVCLEDARVDGNETLGRIDRAISLFKRASVPVLFALAAILQQVVCQ